TTPPRTWPASRPTSAAKPSCSAGTAAPWRARRRRWCVARSCWRRVTSPCSWTAAAAASRRARGRPCRRRWAAACRAPRRRGARRAAVGLAQGLKAEVRLAGFVADVKGRDARAVSEALARQAEQLHRDSGLSVVPVIIEGEAVTAVTRASAAAAVAVLPAGAD